MARPPRGPDPARALAGAGPDLEHVLVLDRAEDAEVGLGLPLGPPDEAGVAEEVPVRRPVFVGVAVPVRAVRPPRLALVDGAAFDPDRLRQMIHVLTVSPAAPACVSRGCRPGPT
ncbi:hypothetical protein [Nocardioides sp. B-3]|uniref:hypothetical protein n=1 Tax=Nocardioides sp. B-3 TaxID=2895565 RepID=UPI00300E4EB8